MKRKPISHLNRKQLGHLFATITDKDNSTIIDGSCDQAISQKESGEQDKSFGASLLEKPGTWIGRYKLLDVLGEGGMGIVYLAEQEQPIKRQVALKVVKPGMDSKWVVARFEAEKQALALLHHPGIAHVYDAGTTEEGRPFFVMELVTGVPISEYCDQHKLTIEERLELFLLVCDAVQHAHQKGIIHRDIKSSNILISLDNDNAIPKIIDFGIAKALTAPLTERTLYTEQGEFIGTPEYMSPEQAKMTSEGVDTRTDIYSLGVVLYKLLTGVLPFNAKTLREGGIENIRQVIREEDPKTPSTRLSMASGEESTKLAKLRRTDVRTLRQKLHGDLDWITLKAMEKDPERRYVTTHAFAEDIRHHLNHEPVTARSPTIAYRFRKFVRRNRTQMIAASITLVLLCCIVIFAMTYSRASRQAHAAVALRDQDTLQTAQEAFSERRFTDALELIGPIAGSEHVGPQARLLQANILLESGHPQEAGDMLSSLLHNKPEIVGAAHALLARIYWENSDSQTNSLEQAVYHRNEAERLLPETADAFYLGALTSLTVKETMEMLDKALILDPRHYPSRRLHAYTLWASQRYLEMETDALPLIVSRPKDSFGYFLSAIARFELKKYGHALQDIEQALQLTLEDTTRRSELLELRCRTHLVLGQYQRVVFEAENYIKQFPDEPIFSFHKFCAYLGLGQYDQACTTFYRVAESYDQVKQELINWSMKYVFDSLAAGRNWHSPGKRPEGAPFVHMQEAEDNYKEFASKGRRLINKGFAADFSPDGTKLVYSSGAVGSSGIALYDFNTEQSELLIVPGDDPRWSPDGQYIAFVRDRQILDMAVLASVGYLRLDQREMEQEVWIMRSDGTEARRLALGAWPSWSSDNKYVFYHSRKQNALCKIEAHDLTASPERLLETKSLWPSVSPDGRHVAWIYSDNRLCITNLESSAFKPIHTCDFPDLRFYGGKWAPSGRWFSLGGYNPTVQAGLWIYDMDLGLAKKVLSGLAGTARWSADEKSLVYLVEAPILELWIADIDSIGPGKTFAEHDREMVTYYTRMIQAYPEKAQYYLSRASNYSRLNELEKAIADIERADAITGRTENTARWLARLKAAYKAGDAIPDVPLAGSMSYDSTTGIYTLVGAGLDIWHLFDEFHFAYMQLRGNGSVTARIDKIEHVHNWTKAGLMIRNTLDPASENGTVLITPAGRVVFQWRDREMGITRGTITDRNSITLPYWLRLTRKGNQFTAHHSSDGVQWDAVVDSQDPNKSMSVEIPMNEMVHIGLAVSSHNTTRAAEARISNVTITGSVTPSGPLTFSQDISFK